MASNLASTIDPCLFIHKDMLVLCFVDDLIYVGADVTKIDAMISNLGDEFQLTVEGDISSFLGIQIDILPDGAMLLTQSGTNWSCLRDMSYGRL